MEILQLHRMALNQTQGIGYQKYTTYMYDCTTSRPNCLSILLDDQPLSRYSTFFVFPLTTILIF